MKKIFSISGGGLSAACVTAALLSLILVTSAHGAGVISLTSGDPNALDTSAAQNTILYTLEGGLWVKTNQLPTKGWLGIVSDGAFGAIKRNAFTTNSDANLQATNIAQSIFVPGSNVTFTTNANTKVVTVASAAGGSGDFNYGQFGTNGGRTYLTNGAALTNINHYGVMNAQVGTISNISQIRFNAGYLDGLDELRAGLGIFTEVVSGDDPIEVTNFVTKGFADTTYEPVVTAGADGEFWQSFGGIKTWTTNAGSLGNLNATRLSGLVPTNSINGQYYQVTGMEVTNGTSPGSISFGNTNNAFLAALSGPTNPIASYTWFLPSTNLGGILRSVPTSASASQITNVPNVAGVMTNDGSGGIGWSASFGQTPWLSDINAGNFSLTNLQTLSTTNIVLGGAGSNVMNNLIITNVADIRTNIAIFGGTNGTSVAITNEARRSTVVISLGFDTVLAGKPVCTVISTNLTTTNNFGTISWPAGVATESWTNSYSFKMQPDAILRIADISAGSAAVRVISWERFGE